MFGDTNNSEEKRRLNRLIDDFTVRIIYWPREPADDSSSGTLVCLLQAKLGHQADQGELACSPQLVKGRKARKPKRFSSPANS